MLKNWIMSNEMETISTIRRVMGRWQARPRRAWTSVTITLICQPWLETAMPRRSFGTSKCDPANQRNAEASRKRCQKHGIILAAEREVEEIDATICSVWFDGWQSRRGHDECHKLSRIDELLLFNLSKTFLVALCRSFVASGTYFRAWLIDVRLH